jgi:glycerol uptake facilitator protein
MSGWDRFRARTGGEVMAEYFGTFILVLLGCGSVAVAVAGLPGSDRQTGSFGAANWLIVAWGWGFAVVFGVYVAGGVSGAHINPAVTFAWALRRDFPWRKVPAYWAAQVAGAFTAAALVYATYHQAIDAYITANKEGSRSGSVSTFAIFATFPAPYFHGSWVGPFVDQVVGTAILVALIAALIDENNQAPEANMSAFLVGMVVTVIGLAYGTNAGYAINPARDFGPRLWTWIEGWGRLAFPGHFQGYGTYWWIPVAGPLAGGAAGVLIYDFFVGRVLHVRPDDEEETDATPEPGRVPSGSGTQPH